MTARPTEKTKRLLKTSVSGLLTLAMAAFMVTCGSDTGHGHDHSHHPDEHKEAEKGHDHEGVVVFSHHQAEAGGVETQTVEERPFESVIPCSGQILSAQGDERTLTSPLAGTVSFAGTALSPGMAVNAGQTLFTISARHIVQPDAAPELRAALANAQSALLRAKEQFESNLITKAEYDRALADVNSARAALRNPGVSPVKGASAASPISGYVTECLVRPGDYVEIGAPLATVSTNRRLQLRADVPQRYASRLQTVSGANLVFPHDPEHPISLSSPDAKVVSYAKSSADGLYIPVIIEFSNPGGMAAGSVAEVYLLLGKGDTALTLPRTAITEEEGLYFVYVEESPEHYRKQQVGIGDDNGVEVCISTGLKPGDKVVTKGATLLKLAANSGKAPQGHSHNH